MESTPVFDFHEPWVALIQVSLMFVLPTLVGLVTDRLSSSALKVTLLGGLTLIGSLLTGFLDASLAGQAYDWMNALLNGLVTWGLAVAAYAGILKPAKVIEKVQESTVVQLFGASSKRVEEERRAA